MTNPAILEALAKAMNGPHLPVPGDSKHTLAELRDIKWQNIGKGDRQNFLNQAAAVLELVGPRKLVWAKIHWENYTSRPYLINIMHWPDTPTDHKLYIEKDDGDNFLGNFPTIEAAKSAAQAHADAAHWNNARIGGE